jgi:hypothetical protein
VCVIFTLLNSVVDSLGVTLGAAAGPDVQVLGDAGCAHRVSRNGEGERRAEGSEMEPPPPPPPPPLNLEGKGGAKFQGRCQSLGVELEREEMLDGVREGVATGGCGGDSGSVCATPSQQALFTLAKPSQQAPTTSPRFALATSPRNKPPVSPRNKPPQSPRNTVETSPRSSLTTSPDDVRGSLRGNASSQLATPGR